MNALASITIPDLTVSDQWSCEFEFEEYEIEEDGVFFGSFSGKAELAINDPGHGDFYVKHISVEGRTRRKTYRPYGYVDWIYTGAPLHLSRPAQDCRTFKAHLFRKIEERIYDDSAAGEFFWSEMESA